MDLLRLSLGKPCSKCGEWKLYEEFHRATRNSDGRQAHCKLCDYERAAQKRALVRRERERLKEQGPQGKRCCRCKLWVLPEEVKQRSYCPECYRTMCREYHAANRERLNAAARQRAKKNTHKKRESERLRRLADPEAAIGRVRRWRQNNPEKRRVQVHRRRSLEQGAAADFLESEWRELCSLNDDRCCACGSDGPLTVDHVVPLSKGGSNGIENIQCLCGSCNSSKGTQTIDYRT